MPPLKAQLLLAESLAAYFPEMVFTDSGITVQIHRNTHLYLLGDKAELVELISNLIGVVIGVLLNPRDSVIAFSSVQPISLKHEGYVQFNINLLR